MENKIEIIKIGGIVDNHSARRLAPVVPEPGMKDPEDIVFYEWRRKVTKVGEGEDDYLVEEVPVEVERINRQAFIMKDANQVGVLNILEKVRRSGDVTLFNQTHAEIPAGLQDYTTAPSNVQGVLDGMKKGAASFDALKTIFGDVSFEKLAQMNQAEIEIYLRNYIDKITPKTTEGGNQ